jgi:hypothetical protein
MFNVFRGSAQAANWLLFLQVLADVVEELLWPRQDARVIIAIHAVLAKPSIVKGPGYVMCCICMSLCSIRMHGQWSFLSAAAVGLLGPAAYLGCLMRELASDPDICPV